MSASLVSLLSDGELDTTTAGHGDHGLATLAENENVRETGREVSSKNITNVDNVEASDVTLTTGDDAGTTLVTTTSDHDGGTSVEVNKVEHLLVFNVEADSVVDLDGGIRVSDSSTVVSDDVGNTSSAELNLLYLQELVGCLFGSDAVNDESTLGVVEDAEVFARLLDGHDILETCRVSGVGADLAVDLDQTLGSDSNNLSSVEGVLQSVSKKNLKSERAGQKTVPLYHRKCEAHPASSRALTQWHYHMLIGCQKAACILRQCVIGWT